jgi:two-component system, chemotaxis family, protein-glutamate methylesterase/glutaminase
MPPSPIKVLIVEDSAIASAILQKLLAFSPDIEVVGIARSGKQALDLLPKVQPHVICTDLHMQPMDGLELTRKVMATYPRPILVISASVQREDTQTVFQLMAAGAVDVFPKPVAGLSPDNAHIRTELITKIKVLSGVKVFTRRSQPLPSPKPTQPSTLSLPAKFRGSANNASPVPIQILTIGGSTGGPQAFGVILSQLPGQFPIPILCTLHISQGFLQGFIDWLNAACLLNVKIAQMGEYPMPGTVYFAPERKHLTLDAKGRLMHMDGDAIDGHCPSVTAMFQSVAQFYGKAAASILLTGMGKDGANGMLAIALNGGKTIAQDESSCVVFGMPKEAIQLGAAQHILPLQNIAPFILDQMIKPMHSKS